MVTVLYLNKTVLRCKLNVQGDWNPKDKISSSSGYLTLLGTVQAAVAKLRAIT